MFALSFFILSRQYCPLLALVIFVALLSACNTTPLNSSNRDASPDPKPVAALASPQTPIINNFIDEFFFNTDITNSTKTAKDLEDTSKPTEHSSLPAAAPSDLWQRVREGFEFSAHITNNPEGQQLIERYRQRILSNDYLLKRIAENASPYLYFVVSELEKHQIPLEIALLPIIESRYDPFAYSPGRASGMWQFIPATGRRFELKQDWWRDQRRDTTAATGAAIEYLSYLYKRFNNDWLLAMAAYNAGQGNVAKAIRKNKKRKKATDYWALDLPKETRHYIPKLLAWRSIVLEPERYGISLNPIPNEAYSESVNVGSQIDLAEAASLAEVDIDTIYQLNPAYNRWATDPEPPHTLLVPITQAETFRKNLQALPLDQRMTWRRYIIKRNDSLIKIAKKFNTTPRLISQVNGLQSHRIRAGKALLIPSASKESDYYSKSSTQRLAKRQARAPGKNKNRIEHRVSSGESLWDISRQYGVSVSALAKWNGMAPKDVLTVGKELVVWAQKNTATQTSNERRKLYYTVKRGDSLAYIADKFRVRINDIKQWNKKVSLQKYIQPGQQLTLYVALTQRQTIAN